jgi:hypothetical protein
MQSNQPLAINGAAHFACEKDFAPTMAQQRQRWRAKTVVP